MSVAGSGCAATGAAPVMDRDEFSAWLRLLETPGVGRGPAGCGTARLRHRASRAPSSSRAVGLMDQRDLAQADAESAMRKLDFYLGQ